MNTSYLYVPAIERVASAVDYFVVYFETPSLRLSSDMVIFNLKDFKGLGRGHIQVP
jgi:hypothetical protein